MSWQRRIQRQLARRVPPIEDLFDDVVLTSFVQAPESTLYHFTSIQAAQAILTSHVIWATDFRDTNDENELRAADETILRCVEQFSRTDNLSKEAFRMVFREYASEKLIDVAQVFVACFTANVDNDHLWQSEYGHRGKGCAIGFRPLPSERFDPGIPIGASPFPIIYDQEHLGECLVSVFQKLDVTLSKSVSTGHYDQSAVVRQCRHAILRVAALASSATKEAKWAKEQEWRIACLAEKDLKVHIDPVRKRRYIELPFRTSRQRPVLDEIVVGPKVTGTQVAQLATFLSAKGYRDVPVRQKAER